MRIRVNKPQFEIITTDKPRNLSQMGQGGGKTFNMAILSYHFLKYCPNSLGLIAANTYGQLSDSTLREIFEVWKKYFGLIEWSRNNPDGNYVVNKQPPDHFQPHGHTFTSNNNKIFLETGQVVMTASLDSYKNIEGRTIAWAMLDETVDTKEEAVKEVITGRLREKSIALNTKAGDEDFKFIDSKDPRAGAVINPLFIFTKPAKEQWLNNFFDLEQYREEILSVIFSDKTYFKKDTKTRRIVIASGFFNAKNLPKGYFENRIHELPNEMVEMLIYGSPFGKSGAEYYTAYSYDNNVTNVQYLPDLPLHISFDFNVNPYMTLLVSQVVDQGDYSEVRIIQEYTLSSPYNTIEDACKQFLEDYEHLCYPGVYYYGDASGKNKQPTKVKSFFNIVEHELKPVLFSRSRRLLKSNPRHRTVGSGTLGRREFMNKCLKGNWEVKILIDESCEKLRADLEFIRENANGAKLKEMAEINGVRCEKYGHTSDALDGLVCYLFGDYNREK